MNTLILRDVNKFYGDGDERITALNNVSLEVASGELVAVVGPSGSGKTTLLAIAGALLAPTSGQVILNGREITGASSAELGKVRLKEIGFVLQTSNLIPYLRAQDQLLLIAELAGKRDKAARERADDLLKRLGLEKRARHYPDELSGGERQRVAIARALMNDPAVILADEPTANLDFSRGHDVVTMLAREVKQGNKAGVLVTHDERLLDLCDRVIRIADGKLSVPEPAVAG